MILTLSIPCLSQAQAAKVAGKTTASQEEEEDSEDSSSDVRA